MSDENYMWKDRQRASDKRADDRDRWINFVVWISILTLIILTIQACIA